MTSFLLSAFVVRAENLPFKSYTTSEGLAHDRVNRIVRDSRGFLWFCTSEGLSRFDGYEFKNYTQDDGLPHRSIFDFLETRTGELWIAIGSGIVLFNPQGSIKPQSDKAPMFRAFRPADVQIERTTWFVQDLLEDRDGIVWAATSTGIYRLEKSDDWQLQRFDIAAAKTNKNENFSNILEDRTGAIWAGTESGLYRILPDKSGVQMVNANMRIESFLEDRDGRVWVGSAGGSETEAGLHLFAYDGPEPREIRAFHRRDGLSDETWMNELLETADGRIFVGVGNGLCEYTPHADASHLQFRILSNEGVVGLAEDASGNVWFSTNSSGVRRLAQHGFVNFDESDNLSGKRIASIIPSLDGETYVLAQGSKIHRFNGKNFDSVTPRGIVVPGWGTGQITFRDHLGAWWISGSTGLQRYPPVEKLEDLATTAPLKTYTTDDGLFTNEIFRLFEDSRGDIWISNMSSKSDALAHWERATDTIRRFTADDGALPGNVPTAFAEDRAGNVWIGYYDGGLQRYRAGKFDSFDAADNLPAGFINYIFNDSGGRIGWRRFRAARFALISRRATKNRDCRA